jgi:hypothetical protein
MLASGGLIISGALGGLNESQRWVRVIFGTVGLLLGVTEVWHFLRPPVDKRAWMYAHMTRFLSAYIATVTAFSVINFQFLPYFWRWLWPTTVGTVGITAWRIYYARKFKTEERAS